MARRQHKTKSELLRGLWRMYSTSYERREREEEQRFQKIVDDVINDAATEQKAYGGVRPLTPKERETFERESQEIADYGARRAKELGIKPTEENINKMIYEYRKEKRQHASRRLG